MKTTKDVYIVYDKESGEIYFAADSLKNAEKMIGKIAKMELRLRI